MMTQISGWMKRVFGMRPGPGAVVAGACLCACVGLAFAATGRASAGSDDQAVLRELAALREELAAFREEFRAFAASATEGPAAEKDDALPSDEEQRARYVVEALRLMKSAALMYYADHMGESDMEKNFGPEALARYFETGRFPDGGIVRVAGRRWLVGCDLSGDPETVRTTLQKRARSLGLLDEEGNDYSGGVTVVLFAR